MILLNKNIPNLPVNYSYCFDQIRSQKPYLKLLLKLGQGKEHINIFCETYFFVSKFEQLN